MTVADRSATTQTRHPWRATVRTALQVLVGLALLLPLVAGEIAAEAPELGRYFAVPLTVAAIVTRVMAIPQVEAFLRRFVPWLAADPEEPAVPANLEAAAGDRR